FGTFQVLGMLVAQGAYKMKAFDGRAVGVFTNTTPTDAYRGAGRPEATYLIERVMDLVARETGIDPVEVRRKNFVRAEDQPFTTLLGLTYDSGDYTITLDKALEMVDYAALRREQAEHGAGRQRGPHQRHEGAGEGAQDRRPSAGGGRGRRRLRERQGLRERHPVKSGHHPGDRYGGIPDQPSAERHGGRLGGDDLLRSQQLRLAVRSAHLRRGSRSRDRRYDNPSLCRGR